MSTSRKVFTAVVVALAAAILVLLGVGLLLAKDWRVETKTTLTAAPEQIAAFVSDLATWETWSSTDANLGSGTTRVVEGPKATVGQRIVWNGPLGTATLVLTAVTPDEVEYRFGGGNPAGDEPRLLGIGRVEWRAAATGGTEVRWLDSGTWDGIVGRWFGWFGALQERVRQFQGTSLHTLQQVIDERSAGKGNAPK